MKSTIAALAILIALSGGAQAQSWIQNNAGKTTGSVVPNVGGGSASIRDNAGKTVGTIVPTPGGGAAIRDTQGRTQGYVVTPPANRR